MTRLIWKFLVLSACSALVVLASEPARTQDLSPEALIDRMERMERKLGLIIRQLATAGVPAAESRDPRLIEIERRLDELLTAQLGYSQRTEQCLSVTSSYIARLGIIEDTINSQ